MGTEAKVFITQIPHRKDAETGAFVPAFNIGPAAEFGELTVMLPPRTSFHATAELVMHLRKSLDAYNFERGDHLLALGDPAIIAAASALLGRLHGKFSLLKWDRNIGRYIPAIINVF